MACWRKKCIHGTHFASIRMPLDALSYLTRSSGWGDSRGFICMAAKKAPMKKMDWKASWKVLNMVRDV